MRGIMHGFPELLEIRPQVQAVPFRLLHQRKTLVAKWQIVVQAAHADGLVFGHQAIDQKTPRLLVTHQRIAVVGKRQRYDAFPEHVRNPKEGNARLRLPMLVERDMSAWLPTVGIGENLHPLG